MAITADILKNHFGFNDTAVIQGILNDPSQVSRYEREYTGGNPTPNDSGQVSNYLNIYQKNLLDQSNDPALQSIISTYAPNLQPLGGYSGGSYSGGAYKEKFTVPDELAGKSLSQISGLGNTDAVASFFGIDRNTPLKAGQVLSYAQTGTNEGDIKNSSEYRGVSSTFGAFSPPAPDTSQQGQGTQGLPQPINRVEEFLKLRQEMGVGDLEDFLVELKAQQEFLYAEQRARTNRERGEPIPQGVIEGRVGKIEQQQAERLDSVRRLIQTTTDQLNVSYGVISTFINYLGQDYEDAVNSYNDQFNRTISIYGLINDAKKTQIEEARFQTQLQIDQIEYQQNIASTNLQLMMNAISSGNISYDDLPAEQQLSIRKLEVQAGLPVGFTNSLKMNPKDQVLFQSTNKGITQVGFIQPDGSVEVKTYGTYTGGGSDTQTDEEIKQSAFDDARNFLDEKGGNDKFVSPDEWNAVKSEWVQADYSAEEFDNAFAYTYVGSNYRGDIKFDEFNLESNKKD